MCFVSSELVQKDDTRSSGMICYGMCGMLGLIACFHSQNLAFNDLTIDSFSLWNSHFLSLNPPKMPLQIEFMIQMAAMFKWILLQFK